MRKTRDFTGTALFIVYGLAVLISLFASGAFGQEAGDPKGAYVPTGAAVIDSSAYVEARFIAEEVYIYQDGAITIEFFDLEDGTFWYERHNTGDIVTYYLWIREESAYLIHPEY